MKVTVWGIVATIVVCVWFYRLVLAPGTGSDEGEDVVQKSFLRRFWGLMVLTWLLVCWKLIFRWGEEIKRIELEELIWLREKYGKPEDDLGPRAITPEEDVFSG